MTGQLRARRAGGLASAPWFTATVLGLLILVVAAPVEAIPYISAQSGSWSNPMTWMPIGVPGPADTVTIMPGHRVGLADPGQPAFRTVASLHNQGVLFAHWPRRANGSTMWIFTPNFINDGWVIGERGQWGVGGSVFITTLWVGPLPRWFPVPGSFTNNGTIVGGRAWRWSTGGSVLVYYPRGSALNTGRMVGGRARNGGTVWVWATQAANWQLWNRWGLRGARSRGGWGGSAYLLASSWPIWGPCSAVNGMGSVVRGGRGAPTFGSPGGNAAVMALGWRAPALNLNNALIRSGDGCGPGWAWLFGSPTINRGRVQQGRNICPPPPRRRVRVDPPQGFLKGEISGANVDLVAGDLLVLGTMINQEQLTADNDLTVTLAPGGVLDLTSNGANVPVISAPNVTINADTIVLPFGIALEQLVDSGNLVTQPGAHYRHVGTIPDIELTVEHGTSFLLPIFAGNLGNLPENQLDLVAQSSSSWWSPALNIGTSGLLVPAMDGVEDVIEVNVPNEALPGDVTSIGVLALTDDNDVRAEATITLHVVDSDTPFEPIDADFDVDEDVDLQDFAELMRCFTDPSAGSLEDDMPDDCLPPILREPLDAVDLADYEELHGELTGPVTLLPQ
jgi:hypothetical protein